MAREMTREECVQGTVALLATVIEMSDHAKEQGGATSIAGVAALHRMQSSIQKNRTRMVDMMRRAAEAE